MLFTIGIYLDRNLTPVVLLLVNPLHYYLTMNLVQIALIVQNQRKILKMIHLRMCQLHATQLFKKVLEVRLLLLGASK